MRSRVKFIANITPNWSAWFVQAGKFYLRSVLTWNGIQGRGKSKITLYQFWDNVLKWGYTQIDANGCAECPDCYEKIKVGTAGIQNMHKTHWNSQNCQNTIAKKQWEKKRLKNGTLDGFLCPRPAFIASTVHPQSDNVIPCKQMGCESKWVSFH